LVQVPNSERKTTNCSEKKQKKEDSTHCLLVLYFLRQEQKRKWFIFDKSGTKIVCRETGLQQLYKDFRKNESSKAMFNRGR